MKSLCALIIVACATSALGAQVVVVNDSYPAGYMLGRPENVGITVVRSYRANKPTWVGVELRIKTSSGTRLSMLDKREFLQLMSGLDDLEATKFRIYGGYRVASIEVGNPSNGAVRLSAGWETSDGIQWMLIVGVGKVEASALIPSANAIREPLNEAMRLLEEVERLESPDAALSNPN